MKTSRPLRTFIVTITTTGYTYNIPEDVEFDAEDANHAERLARKMMRDNGHTRHDGPVHYKVRVAR